MGYTPQPIGNRWQNQKPGISQGLQRIAIAIAVVLFIFLIPAFVGPKIPSKIPKQQIRDSIGAAKFAFYQGARP